LIFRTSSLASRLPQRTPLGSAYVLEERAQKLIHDVVESVRLTREAAGFSAERFKLGSL
jgi:LysR family malonate utilization transcriptional regulator